MIHKITFSLIFFSCCPLSCMQTEQVTPVCSPAVTSQSAIAHPTPISPISLQLQKYNRPPQERWRYYRKQSFKLIGAGACILGGELTGAAGTAISIIKDRTCLAIAGTFFSLFASCEVISAYVRHGQKEANEEDSTLGKLSCTSIFTGIKQLWRERKKLKASQLPQPAWNENA